MRTNVRARDLDYDYASSEIVIGGAKAMNVPVCEVRESIAVKVIQKITSVISGILMLVFAASAMASGIYALDIYFSLPYGGKVNVLEHAVPAEFIFVAGLIVCFALAELAYGCLILARKLWES